MASQYSSMVSTAYDLSRAALSGTLQVRTETAELRALLGSAFDTLVRQDVLGPVPADIAAALVADGQGPLFGDHDAALVADREQSRERQRAPLFG